MDLRPYQTECVEAVFRAREQGRQRVLFVLPTGTGKTTVFCTIVDRLVREERRPAMILAHRDELITQAANRMRSMFQGYYVGVEAAGVRASSNAHVVVSSVQTIGRKGSERLGWLASRGPSVIVIDECHHCAADGYQRILERFGAYDDRTFLVGCTATPKRLDRKALHGTRGATFEEEVYRYEIRQAIEDGWLSPIRGFRVVSGVDVSGVKTTGGDFNKGQLARAVNVAMRTENAINHWDEVARSRKTVVFCASVEHAEDAAKAWRDRGVTAECVHGALDKDIRKAILGRLSTGETQVITNVEVLTEGFDQPDVSCVVMLRPTQSWGMYTQMVGRGTRLAPGKEDLIVIDVVDNCQRHSLATVPAILDLPPDLDLQGESLTEVAERLEKAGAAAAGMENVATFKELQTRLQQVDFFAKVTTPPAIAQVSPFNWLAVPGGYFLACGTKKGVRITQDALGVFHLLATDDSRTYGPHTLGDDMAEAFAAADRKIIKVWPEAAVLIKREARWRNTSPTEGQIKLLKRKFSDEEIAGMTKGQASAFIDQMMQSWNRKRDAARV